MIFCLVYDIEYMCLLNTDIRAGFQTGSASVLSHGIQIVIMVIKRYTPALTSYNH